MSLRPNHLTAVHVSAEDGDLRPSRGTGERSSSTSRSRSCRLPTREFTPAVERYLDDLDERWHGDTVTIVIPEFVTRLLSPTQPSDRPASRAAGDRQMLDSFG